jgi:Effector Associated Constant Component 1
MKARIRVPGNDSGRDLASLHEWLRNEDALRGHARLARAPSDEEEMGAAQDAIVVALGSGGAVTVLASALPVWLRQRRGSRIEVEVEVTDDAGKRRVIVLSENADDAERALRQALDAVTPKE